MNPAEMTSYFTYYEFLKNNDLMDEGIPMYIICGLGAGVTSVCVANPFDVIRTV